MRQRALGIARQPGERRREDANLREIADGISNFRLVAGEIRFDVACPPDHCSVRSRLCAVNRVHVDFIRATWASIDIGRPATVRASPHKRYGFWPRSPGRPAARPQR